MLPLANRLARPSTERLKLLAAQLGLQGKLQLTRDLVCLLRIAAGIVSSLRKAQWMRALMRTHKHCKLVMVMVHLQSVNKCRMPICSRDYLRSQILSAMHANMWWSCKHAVCFML